MPSLPQPNAVYQSYAAKSVWVSSGDAASDQVPSGSVRQLSRIQDTSFSIDYPVSDNTYLDSSVEMYSPVPPGVNANIRYLHTNGRNEWYVGLARLDSSGTLVLGLDEEKNLYIATQEAFGTDAVGAAAGAPRASVIGLGNAVLTSYEIGGQVGGLIESRAGLSALTANVYTGFSGMTAPAVDYRNGGSRTGRFVIPAAQSQYSTNDLATGDNVAALGAQEMVMMFTENSPFGAVLTGQNSCYLQSFNIGLSIDRQEQKPLGYVYPTARPVVYPIRVDLTADAIMSSYQQDQLERFGCNSTGFNIQLAVKQPCTNLTLFGFYFDNLQLQSQGFTQSIGPLDTVSLKWKGYLRTPQDIFFDPYYNFIVNLDTTGAWGTTW